MSKNAAFQAVKNAVSMGSVLLAVLTVLVAPICAPVCAATHCVAGNHSGRTEMRCHQMALNDSGSSVTAMNNLNCENGEFAATLNGVTGQESLRQTLNEIPIAADALNSQDISVTIRNGPSTFRTLQHASLSPISSSTTVIRI